MPQPLLARDQAQAPFFMGVDLGGTSIKAGVVDDLGRTLSYASISTVVADGADSACRRMADLVQRLIQQAQLKVEEVAYVGLGSPGTMDVPKGMLIEPPNLPGWEHFPIRDRLSQYCGKPVAFFNDAGAAAYGEYWQGSGRGMHNMVLLTLGTGVGGGILIEGRSIDGEHSHGAECGHIIIDSSDQARMCNCGQTGHLEAYVGGNAVIKRAQEALSAGAVSSVSARVAAGESLTPLMLAQEGEQGDTFSLGLILETARLLGIGVVSLMHTLDPAAVILGGGMNFGGHRSPLGRQFLERVREEVQRRAFPIPAAQTKVDFAQLGGDAGYIGVAGIARLDYQRQTAKN